MEVTLGSSTDTNLGHNQATCLARVCVRVQSRPRRPAASPLLYGPPHRYTTCSSVSSHRLPRAPRGLGGAPTATGSPSRLRNCKSTGLRRSKSMSDACATQRTRFGCKHGFIGTKLSSHTIHSQNFSLKAVISRTRFQTRALPRRTIRLYFYRRTSTQFG